MSYGYLYTRSKLLDSTSISVARKDLAIWCWSQQDVMCFGVESHAHNGHPSIARLPQLRHQLTSSWAVQLENSRSQRNITLCQLIIDTFYKFVTIFLNVEKKKKKEWTVRRDKSLMTFVLLSMHVVFFLVAMVEID